MIYNISHSGMGQIPPNFFGNTEVFETPCLHCISGTIDGLILQQTSIIVYRLPTKENQLRFPLWVAENKQKFAVSVFRLQ